MIHVVTVGRNCAAFAERNLFGLLNQDVPEWRCVWVDDASTDGTADLVERTKDQRVTLIRNPERLGAFANRNLAIALAQPDDIIVLWDADDFYESPRALSRIAAEYADPECWLTYGHFRTWPGGHTWGGDYDPETHAARSYRRRQLRAFHPQTFRAWLYGLLEPADKLDDDGRPWQLATDAAVMIPLLEMAGPEHSRHIPDTLYLYNSAHPATCWNSAREQQLAAGQRLRSRKPKAPYASSDRHRGEERSVGDSPVHRVRSPAGEPGPADRHGLDG